MKKVLVAGGGGYIGSVLCEELLNKGYEVCCLDRFFFGKDCVKRIIHNDKFRIIQDDLRFFNESVLDGVDAVIQLAGLSNDPSCDLDPQLTFEVNLGGNNRLADFAKKKKVKRFIFASSCSVYGAGESESLTENSPTNPVSLYAKTKLECEEYLKKLSGENFCVSILRNATVYGISPRMRFDLMVNLMTAHAVTSRKIFVLGGGKQWRPNIHVKDLARIFLLFLEAPAGKINGEIFNVGSNEQNYQVLQVANMVSQVIPYTEVDVVPDDLDKRNYKVCFDKIKKALEFEPRRSILEGIVEVKQALERSDVNFGDMKTVTIKYYKYLIEANRILEEVKLNGKIF